MTSITLPPWSYSSLNTFEQCPKQYYHRYILKEREPQSEAIKHGNLVDTALHNRVKDNIKLPQEYSHWDGYLNSILKYSGQAQITPQHEFGIKPDFSPCGFWDKQVWGRGKADITLISYDKTKAVIIDYKTGKVKENPAQINIFSAFMFRAYPSIKNILGFNLWLKNNTIGTPYTFDKAHEGMLWNDIVQKVQRVELAAERGAQAFIEKPSGLCGWCPVRSCQYNRG